MLPVNRLFPAAYHCCACDSCHSYDCQLCK